MLRTTLLRLLPIALFASLPLAPAQAADWSFSMSQSNQGSWGYSAPGYSAQESWGSASSIGVSMQNGQLTASQSNAGFYQGSYQTPNSQASWGGAAYDSTTFSTGPNGTSYQANSGQASYNQGSYTDAWGGTTSYSNSSSSSSSYSYSNPWGP